MRSRPQHVVFITFPWFNGSVVSVEERILTTRCCQVFLLLVAEMVIFMSLIIPLPFTWRVKLFTFISESPLIAKLQYGMKVGRIKLAVDYGF